MKIVSIQPLAIPDVKVIRFARFGDERGFFTEPFRKSDWQKIPGPCFGLGFVQINESCSECGVCRGLHFQWNPFMGKLVRVIYGRMIDLVLDIRKGSPTAGKLIAYDMPASVRDEFDQWIWVPPGFAHGNFFIEDSRIEYLCSGEYSPGCEAVIYPFAGDIDWSLCESRLEIFRRGIPQNAILSEKDTNGFTVTQWFADKRSDNFIYGLCEGGI